MYLAKMTTAQAKEAFKKFEKNILLDEKEAERHADVQEAL